MPTLQVLEKRLEEAEEALHELRTGSRATRVSHNNWQVNFSEASKLESYISDLKNEINRKKGKPGRRPIQLWPS